MSQQSLSESNDFVVSSSDEDAGENSINMDQQNVSREKYEKLKNIIYDWKTFSKTQEEFIDKLQKEVYSEKSKRHSMKKEFQMLQEKYNKLYENFVELQNKKKKYKNLVSALSKRG